MIPKAEPKKIMKIIQVLVIDGDFVGGDKELNKIEISRLDYPEETTAHINRLV